MTAFQGSELTEERWIAYFAHYINLIFCQLVLDFVGWYEEQTGQHIDLSLAELKTISVALAMQPATSIADLADAVEDSLVDFEAAINTVSDAKPLKLSMQAAPIDLLTAALLEKSPLIGKQFFFLIDEYENFTDYQQRVVNTIIKHSSSPYTFKVGVRELGLRQRATLAAHEQLTHPADYARIPLLDVLKGSKFKKFAQSVVETRVRKAYPDIDPALLAMPLLLPELSEMDEADALTEPSQIEDIFSQLTEASTSELAVAKSMRVGELMFLRYWASAPGRGSILECLRDWIANNETWRVRMVNHFHASLFTIRKGKTGFRKYYVGWETFLTLSNGNIRYLIELVHTAFLRHLDEALEPPAPVSAAVQTRAAQEVGSKNLAELEGLSVEGARLTKLLLSLGRIFQVLAAEAAGHAPEVNQFALRSSSSADIEKRAADLINHAVMHQAIVRHAGSKPLDETDTREFDYSLHPVFAPLFVFSYRRKRKLSLEASDVLGMVENHRETIRRVLRTSNRPEMDGLPDQLNLFGGFYEEH
ncbi:hypothetical protein [Polaromonas sp. YR568]|uniref:ORC-CDC6 family AAA ATPase n=1 Tax=Polaromonas sp. YR568 TaxID=1855301 RepID=UPI001C314556|nr:hypothetical protein [Polaromonas sp. YR568]